MSEHKFTTSPESSQISAPQPEDLQPAVVDYIVKVLPVDNPQHLEALKLQYSYQIWKVLVDQHGQVVQVLKLLSSGIIDKRYLVN